MSIVRTYKVDGFYNLNEGLAKINSDRKAELSIYYEGIHLCRVGYENVTQMEIKEIKYIIENK